MRVSRERSVDSGDWDRLVAGDPASSFYHERAWMDALVEAYRYYHPLYLVARDDAGRLLGAIPAIRSVRAGLTQLLSLPYGTYGDPLVTGSDVAEQAAVRDFLLSGWLREARRPGTVRAHLVLYHPPVAGSLPAGLRRDEATHLLDLSVGFDPLWNSYFQGDKRTECRKAEREGVVVRDVTGADGAATLESLYRRQAEQWTNHTPFPPGFLARLVERDPQNVRVWVAAREGTPLAAQLVLHHKREATTWLASSAPEARRFGAGTFLYRAVIEEACARGHTSFNLGGSQGNPDLEAYKSGFGTSLRSYASFLHEPGWFRPLHRLNYRLRGIR